MTSSKPSILKRSSGRFKRLEDKLPLWSGAMLIFEELIQQKTAIPTKAGVQYNEGRNLLKQVEADSFQNLIVQGIMEPASDGVRLHYSPKNKE